MEERGKSKPAVSVIIPVYNLENYLDTCLDSVGRQTYGDFEAIVVDDGSTDGSQAVARRHAERDARIVVVRTVNQGTARARETGIRHAQGDYICFLDGDDVWDSRMLERPTKRPGARCAHRTCKGWISSLRRSTMPFP